MIFLSAGHHFNPQGADPGAVNKEGVREADLTRELRDLVAGELKRMGAPFIIDKDSETLPQYLHRIKPGSGSVVCEFHFNAASESANGVEVIVNDHATVTERKLANDIALTVSGTCGIFNRGVKTESQSHRGHLGLLNTRAGISVLPEICFITNQQDLRLYRSMQQTLAYKLADLLFKYDKIYS